MHIYAGYSNYGISAGTSIISLSFIAVFAISLEAYVDHKEKYEHLYGGFMFAVISTLIALVIFFTFMSFFFQTTSFVVHLVGIMAFFAIFIPFYERWNLSRFFHAEEKKIIVEIERL